MVTLLPYSQTLTACENDCLMQETLCSVKLFFAKELNSLCDLRITFNHMASFKLILSKKKNHPKSNRFVHSCCLQSTIWQMIQTYSELFLQFLDTGFAVKSVSEG